MLPKPCFQPVCQRIAIALPILLLALLLIAGTSASASSAGQATFDGLTVHYSAISSTRLDEEIANRYNIPRSRIQGLLLISARRDHQSVALDVRGDAVDRRDRRQNVQFREIETDGYLSYIGLVRVEEGEVLHFELTVRERDASTRHPLRFSERFHGM